MSRRVLPNAGSVWLIRQAIPKVRWKNQGAPEYAPNWIVRLRVSGGNPENKSSKHAICDACMATVKSPTQERPDCRCQKPAKDFADAWLKKALTDWQDGRMESFRTVRRLKSEVPLQPIFEMYEKNGPQEARQQRQRATNLLEQATGLPLAKLTTKALEDDPASLVVRWAAMRQVYAERGWDARKGSAPKDAWERLRLAWEEGSIPRLPDRKTVRAVNTTINGYVGALKGIFSNVSRTNYLLGMKIPPLPVLMTVELGLPKPKGFRHIEPQKYKAMWDAAQVLHDEDLQAWVALQLAWRTGLRTVELRSARPHWLVRREGNPQKENNGTFLVLKNRPEEGFYLKAKFRGMVRDIRLPQDLVDAIDKVKSTESLLGTMYEGQATDLLRRVSAWIRQFVPHGPHTLYWFRHLAGALRYTTGDTKAAGSLLGHAPGSPVTGDTYIELVEPVEALSDEELHPDRVRLN
jgi:hypothetical protein